MRNGITDVVFAFYDEVSHNAMQYYVLPGFEWAERVFKSLVAQIAVGETSFVTRLQTLITPPMDDLFLDTYYFFVPSRLCWTHWKEFMGESKSSWTSDVEYSVPQLTFSKSDKTVLQKSLLDYFGVPINPDGVLSISRLPINAYNLIWNEWFRDENLQDEVLVDIDDGNVEFDKNNSASRSRNTVM